MRVSHLEKIDMRAIIPHGLYDQYPNLDLEGKYNILFFGINRDYKGLKYLYAAFRELEVFPPDMLLWVVGEDWDGHKVYTDRNIIRINRYVSDDEIPLYFSLASVLVLPYTRASQSGVAHIGMSYGLPIISTGVGGLTEALRGYTGWIEIEPYSTESIREALLFDYRGWNCRGKRKYPAPDNLTWNNIKTRWATVI